MDFLLAAITAMLLSVGITITDKYLTGRLPIKGFIFIIGCFGFASAALLPLTNTALPTGRLLVAGIGIGILFSVIVYCSFRGIKEGEISRLAPLSALSNILIIIGSIIFFSEPITTQKVVAFLFFIIGTILLSTRFERKLEFLDADTYLRFAQSIGDHALNTVRHPLDETAVLGKQAYDSFYDTMEAITNGKLLIMRTRTKIRLVRGFWWYIGAIVLSVPYVLASKWLGIQVGTMAAFVSIRIGLGVGAFIIALTAIEEIAQLIKHKRASIIAIVKEPVGILAGFLVIYAYGRGDLGIVRSVLSFDAVGIFLVSTLFAWLGIVHESVRRVDVVQKAFGVVCIVAGSLILFG